MVWTEKDRNGRALGRVWCGGIDANAEQVRRGMAWVFDRYVKDRGLYPLQERARAQRLGLWADAAPQTRVKRVLCESGIACSLFEPKAQVIHNMGLPWPTV